MLLSTEDEIILLLSTEVHVKIKIYCYLLKSPCCYLLKLKSYCRYLLKSTCCYLLKIKLLLLRFTELHVLLSTEDEIILLVSTEVDVLYAI